MQQPWRHHDVNHGNRIDLFVVTHAHVQELAVFEFTEHTPAEIAYLCTQLLSGARFVSGRSAAVALERVRHAHTHPVECPAAAAATRCSPPRLVLCHRPSVLSLPPPSRTCSSPHS